MAEDRNGGQNRGEGRWEYGSMDQSLIVEEMERLGEHLKAWAEKCSQGNIEAWVLFGKLNVHFWEMFEALEDLADRADGSPSLEEPIEVDG